MSALHRLVGAWTFTMQHAAVPEPVRGRQEYEPVLDGAFLLLRWTYEHPDFPDALALLSDDSCSYFDVRGIVRVFTLEIDDDGWSMERLDDSFSQRMRATFDGPDTMRGGGDASHDSGRTWEPDFTIAYERTQPGRSLPA